MAPDARGARTDKNVIDAGNCIAIRPLACTRVTGVEASAPYPDKNILHNIVTYKYNLNNIILIHCIPGAWQVSPIQTI
jgi:hypothetical protein